jgi:hypothetical protein
VTAFVSDTADLQAVHLCVNLTTIKNPANMPAERKAVSNFDIECVSQYAQNTRERLRN